IRLAGNRYVKIGHHGSPPSREQIETYRNKGAQHLYLRKEDLGKLIHFNVQVAKAATQLSISDSIERTLFLRYTAETILEQTFVVGMNQPAFKSASEFIEIVLSSFENENSLLDQLIQLDGEMNWIYRHSLAVSIYSIMIARQMGSFSLQQVLTAGLAGLFHDAGKRELDPHLMEKSPGLLSLAERETLRTHPTLSREILERSHGIHPDLPLIVEQHHEQLDGKGYPKGLKESQIHPLALVVSGANILAKLVLPPRQRAGKLDFTQALQKLTSDPTAPISPLVLSAIRELHA
ncbi:MAG: HD domain-containing protein, partial [Bdellovibrionales bacterium]|nr:HD domain-containing protein [Bdellovibrionales bacterium]